MTQESVSVSGWAS